MHEIFAFQIALIITICAFALKQSTSKQFPVSIVHCYEIRQIFCHGGSVQKFARFDIVIINDTCEIIVFNFMSNTLFRADSLHFDLWL